VTASAILSTSRPEPRIISIVSYAILLGGAATVVLAAYVTVMGYSSLPFWDGWMQIGVAAGGHNSFSLGWLWRQYNQHRLFIPKLFLQADLRWFHATQWFLLASVFAIQAVHLLLFAWSMRILGGWRGALLRSGAGLAAFCLFCPSQWQNQTMGISGLCFDLPGAFATLSFIGLLLFWVRSEKGASHASWKYLFLAIVAALGGTLTLSNGNLLWPLLVGAALLLRLRRGALASLVVAATLSTAIYLHNYVRPSSVTSSLQTPSIFLKYVATYFGSSWVRSNVQFAELIGVAAALGLLLVLINVPSFIRGERAFCIQLALTMLFCFGTAVFTAAGRLVFGISQAFSSRYQVFALLFWCCLGLLLLERTYQFARARNTAFLFCQCTLILVMLFAASRASIPVISARLQGFQLDAAAVALVVGVPDKEQLQWADSRPDYVLSLVPYLRRERLSVFAGPLPAMLGKPLTSEFIETSSEECTGRVESVASVTGTQQPGLRITGWAWDNKNAKPPSKIMVTYNGVIAGFAVVGDWRPAVRRTAPNVTNDFTGFTGYVAGVSESTPLKIYAVLPGRVAGACLIGALPDRANSTQ
jgi:hypothetical protein